MDNALINYFRNTRGFKEGEEVVVNAFPLQLLLEFLPSLQAELFPAIKRVFADFQG